MYKIQEVNLKHNERLLKLNQETGETVEITTPGKTRNPFAQAFDLPDFVKQYKTSWQLLQTQTTRTEYAVAEMMCKRIIRFTNSLQPLNDDTTIGQLADAFGISAGKVKATLEKLFRLGVYARFEVSEWEGDFIHKKYWVFNPFLATRDRYIDSRTASLFSNTTFAKIHAKD